MVTPTIFSTTPGAARLDRARLTRLLRESLEVTQRDGKRLTQKMLAKELGKVEQTVSRWFRGDTTPSDHDIEQLRRALDWSEGQFAALYEAPDAGAEVDLGAFGLPERFPDLPPLVTDPDQLPPYPQAAANRWSLADQLSAQWAAGKSAEPVLRELLRVSPDAVVVADTGHGLSSAANRLVIELRRSAVLRRSLVLFASIESMIQTPYDVLLERARTLLLRTHPLAGSGRWNPDRDWVSAEGEDGAARSLADAGDPAKVRQHVHRTFAEQVVRSLVLQPWEQVLPADLHDSILSLASVRFPRDPRSAHRSEFLQRLQERDQWRASLARLVAEKPMTEHAWQKLQLRAPRLDGRWYTELLADLHSVGVQVTVVWDLSPTPIGRVPLHQDEPETLTSSYLLAVRTFAAAITEFTLGQPAEQVNNLVLLPRDAAHLLPHDKFRDGYDFRGEFDLGQYDLDDLGGMWRKRYPALSRQEDRGVDILAIAVAGLQQRMPVSIATATMLAASKLSRPAPVNVPEASGEPDQGEDQFLDRRAIASIVTRLVTEELGDGWIRSDSRRLEEELRRALSGVLRQGIRERNNS